MFRDSTFSKKFFDCIDSKISLTCCTETGAVYQNVLHSGRRMANLTFRLILSFQTITLMQRTCQHKSDESNKRVAETKHDACEDELSSERLDMLHVGRALLCVGDKHDLLNTTAEY